MKESPTILTVKIKKSHKKAHVITPLWRKNLANWYLKKFLPGHKLALKPPKKKRKKKVVLVSPSPITLTEL